MIETARGASSAGLDADTSVRHRDAEPEALRLVYRPPGARTLRDEVWNLVWTLSATYVCACMDSHHVVPKKTGLQPVTTTRWTPDACVVFASPVFGVFCPLLLGRLTCLSLSFVFSFLLLLSRLMHETRPLAPGGAAALLKKDWSGRAASACAYLPTNQTGDTHRYPSAWLRQCGHGEEGA